MPLCKVKIMNCILTNPGSAIDTEKVQKNAISLWESDHNFNIVPCSRTLPLGKTLNYLPQPPASSGSQRTWIRVSSIWSRLCQILLNNRFWLLTKCRYCHGFKFITCSVVPIELQGWLKAKNQDWKSYVPSLTYFFSSLNHLERNYSG